jgi:hypothetical protein
MIGARSAGASRAIPSGMIKKNSTKKIKLSPETIRRLSMEQLGGVGGAMLPYNTSGTTCSGESRVTGCYC